MIVAEGLAKSYGSLQALGGISFSIAPGEIFGILGPDGAGKSTLLQILAAILQPTRGHASVAGHPIDRRPEAVKACLGYMGQGLGLTLYEDLSVSENVDFFAELRRVPRSQWEPRKQQLLSLAKLDEAWDRPVRDLSGGMKQKLALCCTLIHEPPILFLDEPTTGVDPISRRDLWDLMARLAAIRKTTVVVTTAYLEEADRCHRVALMHHGQILALDTPDRIRELVPGRCVEVEVTPQAAGLEVSRTVVGWHCAHPVGERIRLILEGPNVEQRLRADLEGAGVRLLTFAETRPTIEEAFAHMVSQREPERAASPGVAMTSWIYSSNGPVVQVQGLTKRFGAVTAIDGISFSVDRGEIFGILGPNGSGKTTTLKMLCGILPPTDGTGRIAGHDLTRAGRVIKQRLGYVSQKFSLYRDLTVAENIALSAGLYAVPWKERAGRQDWVIHLADLKGLEDRRAADLPPGLRQRLALGCALVHYPEILFLDEPTSGVDPVGRRRFWGMIHHLSRGAGMTVLISTHYMDEAEQCDRIALLHAGRLVGVGRPADLKTTVAERRGRLFEVQCDATEQVMPILAPAFPDVARFGRSLRFFSRDLYASEASRSALARARGMRGNCTIVERPISLEEVFGHFIEEEALRERTAARHS